MEDDSYPASRDRVDPYDTLGALYDEWCAGVVEDVPFYGAVAEALSSELGRKLTVLELGSGSGRITAPLAEAGHDLVAVDVAEAQLDRLLARARRDGWSARVRVQVRDMLELEQFVEPASCDLVIAPFRSLLHVTRHRDELFLRVLESLTPGGVFAFDVFHPTAETAAAMDGEWIVRRHARADGGRWRFEERATAHELPDTDRISTARLGIELDVRCTFRPASKLSARRRRTDRVVHAPAAGEPHLRIAHLSLETVPAHAWLRSLEQAGFDIDGSYGWFDGRPLDPHDEDSAWVARRPVD